MNPAIKVIKILRFLCLAVVAASALLLPLSAFCQGSLTPPGAPAPTMKKLDEVEPRTNLQATPAPAGVDTSNPNYHFIINQPGSYYLSANLLVTKTNGIQINAEGVTLDLNGFQISRTTASGFGIEIPPAAHRATVRNGTVKEFAFGINATAKACTFRDLAVTGCTSYGISAWTGAILDSCRVYDNTGTAGISTGQGSVLSNCIATNNITFLGILAQAGCTLTNCAAYYNTGAGGIATGGGSSLTSCSAAYNVGTSATSAGISAGFGSTVTNCASHSNSSTLPATPTTGIGFSLENGCTIRNCTAQSNAGDGIKVAFDCLVLENNCSLNANGAAVHSTGSRNRIEGNNMGSNYRGIAVDGSANLIIRNSARGNTVDYVIAANNRYGPIVDISAAGAPAVNGKTAPDTTGTTHPWANFSY